MAYATPDDVATRWGRELTAEETASIMVRLEDAERMIRRRIPDLDNQINSGAVNVEDVVQVESDCVLRLARNPDGYVSETDGDYSYKLSDNFAAGALGITDDEWAILGVGGSNGMFFLSPVPAAGMYGGYVWRRDAEDLRHHYKVIDWIRQRW